VQYTEQRADWELGGQLKPRPELFKGPAVHPDLASSPALTGANHDGAAVSVKIGLGQASASLILALRATAPQSRRAA
jgi:hypothetical protein